MEETQIVIVGAGPAGLTLGLSLAKHNIQSVVLEKEADITDDPRGVFLAHDAVRILWDLGIGDQMGIIGHEIQSVNFHESSFAKTPFYSINTSADVVSQALPNGILQVQPHLERALRDAVGVSKFCQLRCSCTVDSCEEAGDALVVGYSRGATSKAQIKCAWLIGADGKRGVVRKHFLEASAGILQQDTAYRYDGTWVASNLRITLPTPESHPSFPLWARGYTPEQVYELFWPRGWHFARPPGKATATGRFGPHSARLWRHEFEQNDWHDGMDAEAMLWEHIIPMITRTGDTDGVSWPCGPVVFPHECINVLHCRPFRFTHKLVNRWFDDRTILIGDAAHVFPPFGGQGIASGVRDAHQLSWRLALLCQPDYMKREHADTILSAWAVERTSSVHAAANLTKINGQMCNGTESYSLKVFRWLDSLANALPFLPKLPSPSAMQERNGFKRVENGFFSPDHNGGGRLAQVWIQALGQNPILSDTLLRHSTTLMTLLVVDSFQALAQTAKQAQDAVGASKLHPTVLSNESIVLIARHSPNASSSMLAMPDNLPIHQICQGGSSEAHLRPEHSETAFLERFGQETRYVIVRPDFYIYSMSNDEKGLRWCIGTLKDRLQF